MKLTEKDWTRTGKLCSFIVHQSGDDLTLGHVRRRAVSNPVSSSNNEFTRYLSFFTNKSLMYILSGLGGTRLCRRTALSAVG